MFHDLPSASWSPRKAGDRVQSKSEGLRIQGAYGLIPLLSLKAGEGQSPRSQSE